MEYHQISCLPKGETARSPESKEPTYEPIRKKLWSGGSTRSIHGFVLDHAPLCHGSPGAGTVPADESCASRSHKRGGEVREPAARNSDLAPRYCPAAARSGRVGKILARRLRPFQPLLPALPYGAGFYRKVWSQPGRL